MQFDHRSDGYGEVADDKHAYDAAWDQGINDDGTPEEEYQDYGTASDDVVDVYKEMLDNPFVDDALKELLETRVNDLLDR